MAKRGQSAASLFDINLIAGSVALVLVLIATTIVAAPAAHAQTFTVLHSFTGGLDGANPGAGLTMDGGDHLYGTAVLGGATGSCSYPDGCGTAFRMTHAGSGWTFAPIYSFNSNPSSRVTIGPDGTLYGSNYAGLYNLRPPATPPFSVITPWTGTVIYQFVFNYGIDPMGDLVFDREGNLYGTNYDGGVVNTCSGGLGCGTVYELTLSQGVWTLARLYVLTGQSDGTDPMSGVLLDQAGNVYVASSQGYYDNGAQWGALFELTRSGSGWTETTLHDFQDGTGIIPVGGLISDSAGNIYGTTVATTGNGGGGTVFKLTPSGSGWIFDTLYTLSGGGSGRTGPEGKLLLDASGNLYGTTYREGAYGKGSVFKLTPGNGGWTYASLHDFTGGGDGANPLDGLVMDSSGNLYGTTYAGGITGSRCDSSFYYQCGVVFEIAP